MSDMNENGCCKDGNVVADKVTTKCLSIVNREGKQVATLTSAGDGSGLWMNRPNGDLFALFMLEHQMGIGFYKASDISDNKGMSFAISIGNDGEPFLQYRSKSGDVHMIELKSICTEENPSQFTAVQVAVPDMA